MNEKYLKLQIESIINKILYEKNIIEKPLYDKASRLIDKLLFDLKILHE